MKLTKKELLSDGEHFFIKESIKHRFKIRYTLWPTALEDLIWDDSCTDTGVPKTYFRMKKAKSRKPYWRKKRRNQKRYKQQEKRRGH